MTTAPHPASPKNRFDALDALRGIAILAMLLSSEMPFGANSLPAWMYHAQVPPPEHQFIPNPGITWVDLVFPFFLFSMGAAFPLAMRKRLDASDEREDDEGRAQADSHGAAVYAADPDWSTDAAESLGCRSRRIRLPSLQAVAFPSSHTWKESL